MQGKQNLLVLSKDKDNIKYINQVLHKDYNITYLDNGKTAIDSIRQGQRYDGIISNLYLNGMGGLDLADNLRILGYKTPILFTEYFGRQDHEEIKKVGAQAVNIGYLSPTQLKSTINELVNGSTQLPTEKPAVKQYSQLSNYS